jgi:TPP-dependent pyruvate/acetoin dehydrogenase alpha subunit
MKQELIVKISSDKIKKFYRDMLKVRLFEEKVYYLFLQGILPGTIHQCQGQEAVAIGVCSALKPTDFIASNHRPHGHSLAKGMSVKAAMAELFAKKTGCCKGKGGSMHFADISSGIAPATAVIGESILIATGMALAFSMQNTDNVAVGFFGDGASNIGSFHEGINMGAVWKLPVIYVCENNMYAASTAASTMIPVKNIADRAISYNIPGIIVDGMDVLAVYNSSLEAVERARNGEGPTLLECKTYRYVGHSRSDPAKYRSREEINYWKERDPIFQLKKIIIENNLFENGELREIEEEVIQEIEDAVEYALYYLENYAEEIGSLKPEAIHILTVALLNSGFSMVMSGDSRPASGSEHLVAHYLENISLHRGLYPSLHGLRVGVATNVIKAMYDRFLKNIEHFDWEKVKYNQNKSGVIEKLENSFGSLFPFIKEEAKYKIETNVFKNINPSLINPLILKQALIEKLSPIPDPSKTLKRARIPFLIRDLGFPPDLVRDAFLYSRFMRKRVTILDLIDEAGLLSEYLDDALEL